MTPRRSLDERPRLWVLPDLGCHPTWRERPLDITNIAPEDLDLPGDLASRFRHWAQAFEDRLDGSGGALSMDRFFDEGLGLSKELFQAVPDSQVCYFDDREGNNGLVYIR